MISTTWVQKDLNYLGYNCGAVDGVAGSKTKQAIKSFQSDFKLAVDGIAGNNTCGRLMYIVKKSQEILGINQDGLAGNETEKAYNEFRNIKYFKSSEFNCPHCKTNRIDLRLVKILDMIREHFGKPLIITSRLQMPDIQQQIIRRSIYKLAHT